MTEEHAADLEAAALLRAIGRVGPPTAGGLAGAREMLWSAIADELLSSGLAGPAEQGAGRRSGLAGPTEHGAARRADSPTDVDLGQDRPARQAAQRRRASRQQQQQSRSDPGT